jgi:histidinol-phosphatase (PHP family)
MIPFDYHIHTSFSPDSPTDPEEYCRRAVELGIPEIGFSEHWDVNPYEDSSVTHFLQPEAWWQEVTRLRELFAGWLVVRAGIEVGEPHIYKSDTASMLSTLPFDYVLGSVHFVGEHMMFDEDYFRLHTADEVYLSYFAELEKMVLDADLDIVAHFDIPARTAKPILGYDITRYKQPIRAVLKLVIQRDLALDVNVSGLRKPAANLMPDPLILNWYHDMGGKYLTLGSDAHHLDQLGLNLDQAIRAIRAAGFTHLTRYEQRHPVQVPLDFP